MFAKSLRNLDWLKQMLNKIYILKCMKHKKHFHWCSGYYCYAKVTYDNINVKSPLTYDAV